MIILIQLQIFKEDEEKQKKDVNEEQFYIKKLVELKFVKFDERLFQIKQNE